jgi:hypothetical protein
MCSNLRIFRILKTSKKMWRRHWKLFHNRSSKNVSNSGRLHHWDKCIAAQGEYFEGAPLSKLWVHRYEAWNKIIPGIS